MPRALHHLDLWVRDLAPDAAGWLGSTGGVTADGRAVAIVRFESAKAARANSDRPEQSDWWANHAAPAFSDEPVFVELHWPDGREQLTADTTLAHLPLLPDEELESTLERLRAFERELSDLRTAIHGVIDAVEGEIAARQVAGTTG